VATCATPSPPSSDQPSPTQTPASPQLAATATQLRGEFPNGPTATLRASQNAQLHDWPDALVDAISGRKTDMTSTQPAGDIAEHHLDADTPVTRIGYGAMQLAGPGVWGRPDDPGNAVAVLREAVALGVNFLDTANAYGPRTVNRLIAVALHPYPDGLIVGNRVPAQSTLDALNDLAVRTASA